MLIDSMAGAGCVIKFMDRFHSVSNKQRHNDFWNWKYDIQKRHEQDAVLMQHLPADYMFHFLRVITIIFHCYKIRILSWQILITTLWHFLSTFDPKFQKMIHYWDKEGSSICNWKCQINPQYSINDVLSIETLHTHIHECESKHRCKRKHKCKPQHRTHLKILQLWTLLICIYNLCSAIQHAHPACPCPLLYPDWPFPPNHSSLASASALLVDHIRALCNMDSGMRVDVSVGDNSDVCSDADVGTDADTSLC